MLKIGGERRDLKSGFFLIPIRIKGSDTNVVGRNGLEIHKDGLLIKAVSEPRSNWEVAFAKMGEQGEDALLDSNTVASDWEEEEWEWS